MVYARREKVERVADDIPELEVIGCGDADTLLIGWGGTYGHLRTAAEELVRRAIRLILHTSDISIPSRDQYT